MIRALIALVLTALTSLATAAPVVNVLEARVVGVTDGDTVTVLDANKVQYKIRLAGIDAPEKDQPFGQRSKQSLSNAVMGKPVRVEWSKQDRYGRLVGKVWVTPVEPPLRPEPGRTLPQDPRRQPRPAHGRPRLALQGIREGAERGGPPPLRLRRTGSPRTQGRPLERTRPDPALGLAHGTAGGPIKKATSSGICHAPGTASYSSVKKFTKYPTLEACLASGGRLPTK